MKRVMKILILLMLIFLPTEALAASIKVNCSNSVTVGETITCTVTGYHTTLAGLKAGVSYSGMTYVSASNLSGSNMFVVSKSEMDGAFDIVHTSISLAKYTFKANAAGTAKISVDCNQMIDGTDFSTLSCSGSTQTITINPKKNSASSSTSASTSSNSKSTDAKLKGIELSTGSIDFASDKYTYDLEVDYSVEKIEVKGILNDSKASLKIDGYTNLIVGSNRIKLNVTAEDGKTKQTYIINIVRKEKVLSTNNKVIDLVVNNYNLDFEQDKKEYDLTISNEDYLTIKVKLEDEEAKYDIIGNENLDNGSVIKIIVTAEDGSVNTYSLNIFKDTAKEYNSTNVLIIVICLLVSMVLNVWLMISLVIVAKSKEKGLN